MRCARRRVRCNGGGRVARRSQAHDVVTTCAGAPWGIPGELDREVRRDLGASESEESGGPPRFQRVPTANHRSGFFFPPRCDRVTLVRLMIVADAILSFCRCTILSGPLC